MAAELAAGREEELLAQLRALLFLPAASPALPWTQAAPAVKAESAPGVPLLAAVVGSTITGDGRHGSGPAASASSSSTMAAATADASSCGGGGGTGRRRRQGQGSKRDRDDGSDAKDEQHDVEAPAADAQEPQHYYPPSCKRRKKKKQQQQQSSKSIVTSVPDFDGYQWRKYGQKQIEGAMYPRSYYRCIQSTEQGCQAKRTVQRNDDDGGAAPDPEYTVVYMAEHTCTATDSVEAPVILETAAAVAVPAASTTTSSKGQRRRPQDDDSIYTDSSIVSATSAGSCSTSITTTITTGPESPAITGDDVTCWSSSGASSSDYNYAYDNYYCGGLFAAAADDGGGGWATGPADSASSLPEMEDLTGPIRSPVHVPAPGWTIDHDQLLLQLANEPVCHF